MRVIRLSIAVLTALAMIPAKPETLQVPDTEYVIACTTKEFAERLVALDQDSHPPQIFQSMSNLNGELGAHPCAIVRATPLADGVTEIPHRTGLGFYEIVHVHAWNLYGPLNYSPMDSKKAPSRPYSFSVRFHRGYMI